MFVESRDILMGALIRQLETSNWSLRGTTVSLTKTSYPKKTEKIEAHNFVWTFKGNYSTFN